MKFVILSENRDNGDFTGEGGLSIYLEVNGKRFLLDTGYSSLFLENARKLNIDIDTIETVVLTHGHSDHTNGVPYLNSGKRIIMHPDAFKERYSKRKKVFVGFPMKEEDLKKKHDVMLSREAVEFYEDMYFLGEIPMVVDFEMDGNFSTTLDESLTVVDYTEDDSGIAIKTEQGLVIMTGCGHRGICNTIEQAKKITGEERIYAVLGGFHLRDLEKKKDKIDKTIQYFIDNDVKHLYLGHCVTDDVIEYFKNNLTNIEIHTLGAGKVFDVSFEKRFRI